MREPKEVVRRRFQQALDSFVGKVRQDSYIIAAILCGSLSHDEVWEKSDIDMVLVGRDEKWPFRSYCLVEDGVNIHALLYSRGRFKQEIERALQSSFFHSYISKSTLIFSTDETIREYYDNIHHLGASDQELQLLQAGYHVLPVLAKAEKWLYVKRDPAYSFLWLMYLVAGLAEIEVLAHGEITGREVVQQAMKYNPSFFNAIYFDLIDRPKNAATVEAALRAVDGYLETRIQLLFKPILDYLGSAGGPRTVTELNEHFRKKVETEGLGNVYEWLAQKGVVQQVSAPLRLTEKSRVAVEEAAYYYDGGEEPRTEN